MDGSPNSVMEAMNRNVSGEDTPLVNNERSPPDLENQRWPRKRWYMLLMFCLLAFIQNAVFVEWNAIAKSAKAAFGPSWSDGTFAWMVNLATITSPVTQWPIWWAIQKFGLSQTLRWLAVFPLLMSTTLMSFPLAVGNISPDHYKMFAYAGNVFTGITGVTFFSAITRFSSLWFPPDQRATATGLSITCASLGSLLPAFMGPLMVDPPHVEMLDGMQDELRTQIFHYMLVFFGITSGLFLGFLYFPSHGASRTRSENRREDEVQLGDLRVVLSNFIKLLKEPNVIFIMVLYGLTTLPGIWGLNLLNVTLTTYGISQLAVSRLIITSTLVAFVLTVVVSRVADLCFRFRLKPLVIVLLLPHVACMIGFSVSILTWSAASNQDVVFFFYTGGIAFLGSYTPIIYELVAENAYPIPEDIVAGLLNQFNNLFGVIFYFAFSGLSNQKTNDYTWLLYMLMGVPTLVTILFIFTKETYSRSDSTTTSSVIQYSGSPASSNDV